MLQKKLVTNRSFRLVNIGKQSRENLKNQVSAKEQEKMSCACRSERESAKTGVW